MCVTTSCSKASNSNSRKNLKADRLREVLSYNRRTGVFTWKIARGRCAAGHIAGVCDDRGYNTIRVDGVQHWAHRLAVLYVTGKFPANDVDHKNGKKSDNRWVNLRCVSRSINLRNQRREGGKVFGVSWREDKGKWVARIKVEGVNIYLGHFVEYDDALAARKMAEKKFSFDRQHGANRK